MIYIGLDNGVTGSLGIIREDNTYSLQQVPVGKHQDYTKKKKNISRIDFNKLFEILDDEMKKGTVRVVLERIMINPGRFSASISAARAFEATIICFELLELPYEIIDSKEWQKQLLPQGKNVDTKDASRTIGKRLYPKIDLKRKTDDCDGLLMAHWLMLKYKGNTPPKRKRRKLK